MGEKKPKANFLVRLKMLASLFVVAGFGLVGLRLLYIQVFQNTVNRIIGTFAWHGDSSL